MFAVTSYESWEMLVSLLNFVKPDSVLICFVGLLELLLLVALSLLHLPSDGCLVKLILSQNQVVVSLASLRSRDCVLGQICLL